SKNLAHHRIPSAARITILIQEKGLGSAHKVALWHRVELTRNLSTHQSAHRRIRQRTNRRGNLRPAISLRSTRTVNELRNRHTTKLMSIHTVNTPLAGLFIKPHRVHLTIKNSTLAIFTVDILTGFDNPPRAVIASDNHIVRRNNTHDNIWFTLAPRSDCDKRRTENKRIKMGCRRRNIQIVRLENRVKLLRVPALKVKTFFQSIDNCSWLAKDGINKPHLWRQRDT